RHHCSHRHCSVEDVLIGKQGSSQESVTRLETSFNGFVTPKRHVPETGVGRRRRAVEPERRENENQQPCGSTDPAYGRLIRDRAVTRATRTIQAAAQPTRWLGDLPPVPAHLRSFLLLVVAEVDAQRREDRVTYRRIRRVPSLHRMPRNAAQFVGGHGIG